MKILFSLEFWIGVQLFIDFLLLGLFIVLLGRLKRHGNGSKAATPDKNMEGKKEACHTASEIIDMLEPLLKEAEAAAISFDKQIRDKKNLISGLNDSLDSRIININLLLSRAESMLARETKNSRTQGNSVNTRSSRPVIRAEKYPDGDTFDEINSDENVFDDQNSVIDLYQKGLSVDAIASRLSMPKGEVQLVINLKKKFMLMENK